MTQACSHFSVAALAGTFAPRDFNLEVKSMNARHTAWLRRVVDSKGKATWRPRASYRVGTLRWLIEIDNIQRVSTSNGGLCWVLYKKELPLWDFSNWRSWPTLVIGADQGPKCVCGLSALQYKPEIQSNITPLFEFSHGANNDFQGLLKDLGRWHFALILLIIYNLPHGPDKDPGMRYEQFGQMLRFISENFDPATFALWQARVPAMADELAGEFELNSERGPALSLWDHFVANPSAHFLGERVKMCQYMAWWEAGNKLLKHWSFNLFKAECVSIESDWLHRQSFLQLPAVSPVIAQDTIQSTASTITAIETKILRSCCANNVVVQVAVLSMPSYRRLLAHLVRFTAPLKTWQGAAAKCNCSATGCREWLLREMSDSMLAHQKEMLAGLHDQANLQDCGYHEYVACRGEDLANQTSRDEEMATLAGDIVLGLIAKRQRRNFYLTNSFPNRQWRALVGPTEAQMIAADFKRHLEVH